MISNLGDFLEQEMATQGNPKKFLSSLAYTLGQRRTRFAWLAAHPVTGRMNSVIQTLRSPKFKPVRSSTGRRIVMVITGQGAQWYAMARELVDAYPVYKESLREAEEETRINEVALSTPICVAVHISLVRLLRSWGVVPTAVTSHSSGEIAAAYAAGAISYQAAIYFVSLGSSGGQPCFARPDEGRHDCRRLGQSNTEAYLKRLASGKAIVARINNPSSTTVAGDLSAVMELEGLAKVDGIFARRLKVDTVWHSHHMEPVADAYADELEDDERPVELNNVAGELVAFSSPVTGGRIESSEEIATPYSAMPEVAGRETAAKIPRAVQSFWVSAKISSKASIEWLPDLSFASPTIFERIKKQLGSNDFDSSEDSVIQDIRRVCVYFMQKALLNMDQQDVQRVEPHHAKYYLWMKHMVDKQPAPGGDGEMVCHLGPRLAAILRGEKTPLEIMTQGGVLSRYQSGTPRLKRIGLQVSGAVAPPGTQQPAQSYPGGRSRVWRHDAICPKYPGASQVGPLRGNPESIVIVVSKRAGALPSAWLESLRKSLSPLTEGGERTLPVVQKLESESVTSTWYAGKTSIFVGEMDEPILYGLNAAYLEGIRAISTGCQGLLWGTCGGAYVSRKFLTLDLDLKASLWSEAGISTILQLFLQSDLNKSSNSSGVVEKGPAELEYAERDGVILVPRLYHDIKNNQMMSRSVQDPGRQQARSIEAWHQSDRPLC
ncbi:polyketide synthase module [Apiospora phragmitis]|uniref:Polyketide synthase module n=1 Tax=Apiospora phragmitis TaxID=2905665 RepID=A0ABR1URS8_9PEZI